MRTIYGVLRRAATAVQALSQALGHRQQNKGTPQYKSVFEDFLPIFNSFTIKKETK
jgi:hypothetical protein